MKRQIAVALGLAILTTAATDAWAQPGRGEGGRGGRMRFSPLVAAIDTDADGEISASEIEAASSALKSLDANNDGKLTSDELRPAPGQGPGARGGEFGGRDFGGPGGPGGPGGQGGQGGAVGGVERMMANDANKDGKLSADEVPQRMQQVIARADKDGDGLASQEELTALMGQRAARLGQGRGARGEEGGRGPEGPRGDFGPRRSPEAFVDRAFEFDADGDGKLSREELGRMMAAPRDGGEGGFGGRRGAPEGR
ncbi:MAG: hypothetical protein KDA61_14695 [Planctomycetales bacterium]|nr:hypothetical protein [Planctomycetales bacterium]